MKRCKKCGRKGLFLRLSPRGLCAHCEAVQQREDENTAAAQRKTNLPKTSENNESTISVTVSMHTHHPEIPSYQKDYAKTIFLSWFVRPKEKPKEWPKYFLYELGIRDCEKYLYDLLKEGLLEEASVEERIKFLKVAELKTLLGESGLPSTGKKEQLQQMALENISEDIINHFMAGEMRYCLSSSGHEFVSRHEQYTILYKHKNWAITWQAFDNAHRQDVGIYDTIWGLLNKRVLEEYKQNYGRNAYHSMAECAMERGQPEVALSLFLQVLYIDLCFSPVFMGFAPAVVSSINTLGDYYHLGMVEDVLSLHVPGRTFTQEEFEKIIESIILGNIDTKAIEDDLRKRGGKE